MTDCPINCIACPVLKENERLKKGMWIRVIKEAVVWAAILVFILWLCTGCAHARYGKVEYWRLGKQEVAELWILAPDGSALILRGYRGGENVKPSIKDLIIGEE